jgi:hypothetical protein
MAPRVRQLIADHAETAQVIVLRRRRAARDYLAVVNLQASRSASAVTASEERGLPVHWLPRWNARQPPAGTQPDRRHMTSWIVSRR